MTHTTQTLTHQPLSSSARPARMWASVTRAAARIRARRQAAKETIQPVPFDPELHLIPPFALLVTGPR